jgi:hypothetical protein
LDEDEMKLIFLILLSMPLFAQQREVLAYVTNETMEVDSTGDVTSIRLSVAIDTLFADGRYFIASTDTTITNPGAINILTGDNEVPKNNLYTRILQGAGGRALKKLRQQVRESKPPQLIASDSKKDSLGALINIQAIKDSSSRRLR